MKDFFRHMTLGVLAGGRSSRMGRNKAELKTAEEETFLEHIIGLGKGFNDVIVSEDVEGRYSISEVRYVADEVREIGPLEGIWQILNASWTEYVMIVATDMPRISPALLKAAAEQVQGREGCLVLTLNGNPEPLCSIYSRKVLPALGEMRKGPVHRIRPLFDKVETRYVAIEDLGFNALEVSNVNTPEEYKKYREADHLYGGEDRDDREGRILAEGLDLAEICGIKDPDMGKTDGNDLERRSGCRAAAGSGKDGALSSRGMAGSGDWFSRTGNPPVFGVCGTKKTGKTTLLRGLVAELTSRGYRVVTIKHDGHDFEPDTPGTDSYYLREAGAELSAVFSDHHVAYSQNIEGRAIGDILENVLRMSRQESDAAPKKADAGPGCGQMAKMAADDLRGRTMPDIVLVEGLKDEAHPKLDLRKWPLKLETSSYKAMADMLEQYVLS